MKYQFGGFLDLQHLVMRVPDDSITLMDTLLH